MWQEIYRTLASERSFQNTLRIKTHLAATHVTRNFPNTHVKRHSDEKPLDCFLCDKKFSELSCQSTLRQKIIQTMTLLSNELGLLKGACCYHVLSSNVLGLIN